MCYKAIILDFDGTVCRLFYNYNLNSIKAKLMNLLNKYKIEFTMQNDVFDAFEIIYNSNLGRQKKNYLLKKANNLIERAEIDAINTGKEVKGFSNYLKWIDKKNYLAIVTNNSEECVKEFFKKYYGKIDYVVIGRNCYRPDLLKPHPYMLDKMCKILHLTKNDIVFVGDSARDYKCAREFGCDFIGMAPTQKKKEKLQILNENFTIVENYIELISIASIKLI